MTCTALVRGAPDNRTLVQARFVLALLLAALASCVQSESDEFRVGLSYWPPNEMAFLAEEEGYFQGHNIQLVEFGSPGEYLAGYASGNFDATVVSLGSAIELASLDPSIKIVMLIDYSTGADALVAHDDIENAEDLKGKRIGYEATALGAFMFQRLLELHGISVDDVVAVPVDVLHHEIAFLDRQIDAVVTFAPSVSRLVDAGGRVIADSSETGADIMDVLAVNGQALGEKRADLRAFMDGWFKALDSHNSDSRAAAMRAEARQHGSAAQYLRSLEDIVLLDRDENEYRFMAGRDELLESIERHRSFLQSTGFVAATPRSDEILSVEMILEVSP